MKKTVIFTICACILALQTACTSQAILTGAERDAVLAYSEPAIDNLMDGYNGNEYAIFGRDFDSDMRSAIPESAFASFQTSMQEKIGSYVSREVAGVVQSGEFVSVIYAATFTKDDPVTMRIVFRLSEPHFISGMWFDSPNLRVK